VYPSFVQLQTRLAEFLEREQLKEATAEAARAQGAGIKQGRRRRR
jgi:hypothetical protein